MRDAGRRHGVSSPGDVPTNVSPEYKNAEDAFRRAREPRERLEHLRKMHRTIPKHKGTEHLQADIKTRIEELTDELAGPRKRGARTGPPTVFKPMGTRLIEARLRNLATPPAYGGDHRLPLHHHPKEKHMAAHTLAGRAEARELIRPELALSRNDLPLSIARTFHSAWFDASDDHVRHGRIVIFERAVVGQPTPLLWEVTHLARLSVSVVIAEPDDDLDDEDDERVPEFVIEMLNAATDRARCVDWTDLYRDLLERFDDARVDRMAYYLELQLAMAADRSRVGQGAIAAVWPNAQRGLAA